MVTDLSSHASTLRGCNCAISVRIAVLDPLEGCPAATVVHKHVVGSFRDREAIIEFCQECDVVTVEIEHVDVPALEEVERMGIPVHPSSSTVKIIQDKYAQKEFFSGKGVPVSDFRAMTNDEEAKDAIEDFGLPLMLKSRFLAYDGRGNAVRMVLRLSSYAVCLGYRCP